MSEFVSTKSDFGKLPKGEDEAVIFAKTLNCENYVVTDPKIGKC